MRRRALPRLLATVLVAAAVAPACLGRPAPGPGPSPVGLTLGDVVYVVDGWGRPPFSLRRLDGGEATELPHGHLTQDGRFLLVWERSEGAASTYTVVSTAGGQQVGRIEVPGPAHVLLADGSTAYFFSDNGGDGQILEASVETGRAGVLARLDAPVGAMTAVQAGGRLYVLTAGGRASGVLHRIEVRTGEGSRWDVPGRLFGGMHQLLTTPDGSRAFVVDLVQRTVIAFDGPSGQVRGPVSYAASERSAGVRDRLRGLWRGLLPRPASAKAVIAPGAAISPDGTRLYAVDHVEDSVAVLDAGTLAVLGRYRVGHKVHSLRLNPEGTLLYVLDRDSRAIAALDAASGERRGLLTDVGQAPGPIVGVCSEEPAACW